MMSNLIDVDNALELISILVSIVAISLSITVLIKSITEKTNESVIKKFLDYLVREIYTKTSKDLVAVLYLKQRRIKQEYIKPYFISSNNWDRYLKNVKFKKGQGIEGLSWMTKTIILGEISDEIDSMNKRNLTENQIKEYLNYKNVICVPIIRSSEKTEVLGILALYSAEYLEPHFMDNETLNTLQVYASILLELLLYS